ncbi:MAG: phosphate transport system regulatory protein PhoU [Gammaproteobacteria bacterium]|nr:MAG: phosphate transport system regulatory protein PhoU [Gammaproteobacteria bacterium]
MDRKEITQHISQQFNEELEDLREKVLSMGGLVESQLRQALTALQNFDGTLGETIIEQDKLVNGLEVKIDEECTQILARRQPAAGDLRLIIAVIKTVTDLERIGDEAEKVARMAVELSEADKSTLPSKAQMMALQNLGEHALRMVGESLDAFARMDVEAAIAVARQEKEVDDVYRGLARQLVTYMMEDPRTISSVLDITWAARALERVADHANNIAEYTVYLVKGKDVRHVSMQQLEKTVQEK